MFGSAQRGASVYAAVGLETGVMAASPHQLVMMLFDGAMIAVSSAIAQMQMGDVAKRGEFISKAITIIDNGLRASLNKDVGGDLALNLDALYDYMSRRLLLANIRNQQTILEEVHQLLKGLRDAWEKIGAASAPAANQSAAGDTHTAQPNGSPSRLVKA